MIMNKWQLTELGRDKAAELYAEHKPLVVMLTRRYQQRYGGDMDDLMGISHVAFCSAVARYQVDSEFKFTTLLATWVNGTLLDHHGRKQNPWMKIEPGDPANHLSGVAAQLRNQWTELSNDALTIVELILEDHMLDISRDEPTAAFSVYVRSFLKDRFNWSKERISNAFVEISEALSD